VNETWLPYFVTLSLGLLIGSFLNVVIVRLPRRKSIVYPPSNCVSCKKPIAWYDNIPFLSYLILRGRCRKCGKKISIRYWIVETLTALLFFAVFKKFGWGPLLFVREWPFVAILIAITFIDLRHRIIPDQLSLGGLVLGLSTAHFVPGFGLTSAFIGAASGFGIFYLFAWLYFKFAKRDGLGGGDIKLLAMLGAFLGVTGVFYTVLFSSILGSIVGIGYALRAGKKNIMRVAIPYGPFLVLAALIYYLWGDFAWFQYLRPI
jgi:leader peptidase (prepilin peptidase) / N-methyltransferase